MTTRGKFDRSRTRSLALAGTLAALGLSLPSSPLPGQTPPEDLCTVSVLNQTANVQPDGTWNLPNIPSNMGPVRARVNCIQAGLTSSGTSPFFVVTSNRMNAIPPVDLGSGAATPQRIEIVASPTSLTTVGQAVQLSVQAVYADGSRTDVSASAQGTTYSSTSPRIATVTPEGEVRAVASGRVLISVLHEAILRTVAFDVLVSGDSDGDGLADDLELANGLNPNDPIDALEDLDADGLTNRQELLDFGTAIRDSDTDDDGLLDGEEVGQYGTNPLLRDTDGDEVPDGLEILAGSDPLDPASINLGPILEALTAVPGTLNLEFNTVLGEASQRLTVKGRLIDGTLIDLRRRSRGTSYSSSNLAVASFGSEDGRVFAGQNGTATVTVSNSGRSATVQTVVTTFSPTALSFLHIPGFANGVDVAGGFAYVAAGQAGLQVVNVSDLRNPFIAGFVDTAGNANDVKVRDGYAYVVDGTNGLVIVDVSLPALPRIVGRVDTPGTATDLAVVGDLVYVADGSAGLQVIDAANPAAPVRIAGLDTPGNARGIDVSNGRAVLAAGSAGVQVIDVRDPSHPVLWGSVQTRFWYSSAASVALRGRFAYVADADGFTLGGLRTIDLADPATPVLVGSSSDAFGLNGVALDGNLALTSDVYFVNSVPIFEIGGTQPAFMAAVDFSRSPSFRDDNGNDLAVQDGVVFMVGARYQLADNGVAGDTGLHIGRYRTQVPIEDLPPEVTVTAPADGSSVRERDLLVLRAEATDDHQVGSVQFLVNGTVVLEDFRAPFTTTVRAPVGVAALTVSAVAKDLAGNLSRVASVQVNVIPDDKPTVEILGPLAGSRLVEGSTIEIVAGATDDVRVASVDIVVDGVTQRTFTAPPYRTLYAIPVGVAQLDVQVIATDNANQTATAAATLAIADDPPPVVAILAPSSVAEVVEGAHLRAVVGATDDVGVGSVSLSLDGGPPRDDFTAPYEYSLVVPEGASSLRLTALATDSLGQSSSAELILTVVPDPRTTATGRVVDALGAGVLGATVRCLGQETTSGADGAFSLPGLPTLPGRVACSATASDGSGAALSGGSAVVPAIPGGVTVVGDIQVAGQLLYFGTGNGSGAATGRLYALDAANDRLVPWSRSVPPAGISGLVVDGEGRLYATTEPSFGGGEGDRGSTKSRPGRKLGKATLPPQGVSHLLRLDPDMGAVLETLGPFVNDFGSQVGLQDPTFNRADGQIYALQWGFSGGGVGLAARTKAFSTGVLYRLDLENLAAVPVSRELPFGATGLSAGPDGLLYLLTPNSEGNELTGVDPATGTIVSQQWINGAIGAFGGREVGGMVARPGTGTFLLTSPDDGTEIYELDPISAEIRDFSAPAGPIDGTALGLAFRSLDGAAAVTTTITGAVVDADANPLEGAEVVALGASALTGPDGRFAMPDVQVRTGVVRAAVTAGDDFALSASLPPSAGVTDLGTIVLGAPACVVGTLQQFGCLARPVTDSFDLFLLDDQGGETPVGQVIPDGEGRFCTLLRRRRQYLLRREDLACTCGGTPTCQAWIGLSDPEAAGDCGDPDAVCEELGTVFLDCDLFCGS